VTHRRFDGQIHAFYSMRAAVPAGAEAVAQSCELLGKAFI
jgi:acetyl esterase/lipase